MRPEIPKTKSDQTTVKVLFEQIYTVYFNKIYHLAYRMTGNWDLASDIMQETFLQVLSNVDKYRGDSHIYTWIYAIAKNICFRYLKKMKKKSFYGMEDLIKNASVYDEEYLGQEKQLYIIQVKDGCLLGLLRCLSFNQRFAFILNILFDIPVSEVALMIDKSVNSTRILICRARKNIKEFLCRNCSLYYKDNHCKCENLISFSLKQGWIEKYNHAVLPETIEAELKEFKNEISLYKTVSLGSAKEDIREKIFSFIKKQKLSIFSERKVKSTSF